MFKELLAYVLPEEIVESFDLVKLEEREKTLHLFLDECNAVRRSFSLPVFTPKF